jgi:hypothetical protein
MQHAFQAALRSSTSGAPRTILAVLLTTLVAIAAFASTASALRGSPNQTTVGIGASYSFDFKIR